MMARTPRKALPAMRADLGELANVTHEMTALGSCRVADR